MKQRLLFTLLALFVSIGLVKAQDGQKVTLTIPAKGSISIQFDKTNKIETNLGQNYFSGNTFSYTNSSEEKDVTVEIKGGEYTSLQVKSGSATKIEFSNFTGETFKTLSIANIGLESLVLDGAHANLESLTIQSNKLITVPSKGSKMKTYSIAAQSPDLELRTTAGIWSTANAGYQPSLDHLFGSDNHDYPDNVTFELTDWQYAAGGSANSVVHHTPGTSKYYFYKGGDTYKDGDEYIDGEFTCTVKFSGQYEGVQIKGAHVKVLPALYTNVEEATILPKDVKNKLTYQLSNGVSGHAIPGTVSKGDVFRISATPADGYSIDVNGFSESKGFDIKADGNTFLFTVNGKATPEIKAVFTAEGQKITIKEPSNGSFVIYNEKNEALGNNATPATGSKLTIKATPNQGYKLDKMMLNGEALTLKETDGQTSIFEYTVEADSEELIFSASFVQAELKLTMQWPKDDFKSIALNTTANPDEATTTEGDYYKKSWNVPYGDKPTITLETNKDKYITSIIANNEPVEYKITKAQPADGSKGTTYQITNFDMKSRDVTMVVNSSGKSEAKIIVDFASNENGNYTGEEIVYDGTAKTIPYTTYPANLSNVKVKYYNSNEEELSSVVEAGDYKAVFSRASDDVYAEATVVKKGNLSVVKTNNTIAFTVKEADLVITRDPSVTIDKETGEYKITAGTVGYKRGIQTITIDSKKCVWEVVESNKAVDKTSLKADENGNYGSEVVTVRVHIKANENEDWDATNNRDKNFEESGTIEVKARGQKDELKTAQVKVLTSKMPEGTSLTLMNGGKSLGTSASVLKETTITFAIEEGRYELADLEVYRVDEQGNKVGTTNIAASGYKLKEDDSEVYFLLIPKNGLLEDLEELVLISANDKETNGTANHTYNGKVHNFNTHVIRVKDKETNEEVTSEVTWANATITYKEDATNQVTTAPINAGTYTVTIKREADDTYKEFTATGTMYIEQAVPTIVTWPNQEATDPAYIGEGQALSTAVLTGGVASVEGSFDWITPDKIVEIDGQYDIKFVSKDPNYKDVSSRGDQDIKAYVKITNESILSIAKDDTYTITAKGSDGKTYTNGMTVPVGTTLTFTVTPATSYRLKTLYVNGKAISGNTYKTTAGPVSVKAEMAREYTITLGSAPRGSKIASKPASSVVVAGGSYTFTLNHLSGDKPTVTGASNISVSTSGGTSTVTVSNIQSNATLAIAISATPIKITLEKTLSKAGKEMGTLRASGLNSSNECYYGDKVTITATANAGVEFSGWEGLTSTANPYEFEATQASYTFKAEYDGILTGIESVDEVRYYGADGYIYVNAPAPGTLTIISMNGRSQRLQVSGQTRVTVAAGIYGIVLDMDGEVIRDKVVVR